MVTTNYGGGQIRPTVGDTGPVLNVSGKAVINAISFTWSGPDISGKAGFVSGVNADGHIRIVISGGNAGYIPYWISA